MPLFLRNPTILCGCNWSPECFVRNTEHQLWVTAELTSFLFSRCMRCHVCVCHFVVHICTCVGCFGVQLSTIASLKKKKFFLNKFSFSFLSFLLHCHVFPQGHEEGHREFYFFVRTSPPPRMEKLSLVNHLLKNYTFKMIESFFPATFPIKCSFKICEISLLSDLFHSNWLNRYNS